MNTTLSADSYCQTLVRTQDPDRFLLSLFYPQEKRAALWALYAFHYEIAKTREVVTDTTIGLIRLQWWRDALENFYEKDETPAHEVMTDLCKAIRQYHLPRDLFDHLLYAREFDLEDRQPGSMEGVCNYADYTHTPLLRLASIIVGEDPDHPAVQPVAMAYALTGLIRAARFHLADRRCYLPEDVMRRADLSIDSVAKDPAALSPVIRAMRLKAEDLLRQADEAGEGRLTRLHRVMAMQYLNKIRKLNDNIGDLRMAVAPPLRIVGLWLAARKTRQE